MVPPPSRSSLRRAGSRSKNMPKKKKSWALLLLVIVSVVIVQIFGWDNVDKKLLLLLLVLLALILIPLVIEYLSLFNKKNPTDIIKSEESQITPKTKYIAGTEAYFGLLAFGYLLLMIIMLIVSSFR